MLAVTFSIIIAYMHTHYLEPNIIYSIRYFIYSNSIPNTAPWKEYWHWSQGICILILGLLLSSCLNLRDSYNLSYAIL